MGYSDQFFRSIKLEADDRQAISSFSKEANIPVSRLKFYNENNILPSGKDLKRILDTTGLSEIELMLKMGRLNKEILDAIQQNAEQVFEVIKNSDFNSDDPVPAYSLVFETQLGKLYKGDCLSVAKKIDDDSIDLIFADPPFNLNKLYPSKINDSLKTEKYLHWCQKWLCECIRILKPGGSFFLWNLPRWNSMLSDYLNGKLTFRHWISTDIKYSLPIQSRLYPSHYSLLYYVKGEKPNTFNPDRLPTQTCPKCHADLKDYGGYKDKMNPKGVNLTDIWLDIPPVRHTKYKRRSDANELSIKLLDRIIEMASIEEDIIFDPFGGSGTTYMAAELKNRRWIGCEIGPINDITNRFKHIEDERKILNGYRKFLNALFPEPVRLAREKVGLWTCESVRKAKITDKPIKDDNKKIVQKNFEFQEVS